MTTENSTRYASAFVSNKTGAIELRSVTNGGYCPDETVELVTELANSKLPISNWAVWDATEGAPKERRMKPYSNAEFRKLISEQDVALVWCKRGTFRAPVIKVGAVNERKGATGTRAAPRKIGK
jgi:hypothetical protein